MKKNELGDGSLGKTKKATTHVPIACNISSCVTMSNAAAAVSSTLAALSRNMQLPVWEREERSDDASDDSSMRGR